MSYIIENGRLMQLSVTGIQAFNEAEGGCPQRWHYKNVLGRKEPTKIWHRDGDAVQAQIDHYVLTGENVLGRVAAPGLKLLPRPGADLIVDLGLNNQPRPKPGPDGRKVNFFPREQSLLRAAGLPFIGFLDLVNPRGETVDSKGNPVHDGFIEVIDHKTAKSFKYNYEQLADGTWVKIGGMLSSTQMAGYGEFAVDVVGDDNVRLSHNAYRTDKDLAPAALKATEVVSAAAVRAHWRTVVEPLVERMKSVAGVQREQDVEGNLAACDNFGGCPHLSYCHTAKAQTAIQRMKNMAGLLSKRNTNTPTNGAAVAAPPGGSTPWIQPPGAAAAPPLQPPPQAAPPTAAASPFPIRDVVEARAALQGQKYIVRGIETMFLCSHNGKQTFAPTAGGTPIQAEDNEQIIAAPVGAVAPTAPAPQFLAPPAAAPPPVPVAAPPAAAAAPVLAPPPPPGAVPPPPAAVAAPAPVQAPPQPLPAAEAPKRGRGRPTKAEQAAKAAAAGSAVPAQNIAVAQAAQGITLYWNAVPNGPYTDLSGYVYETTAQLEEQFNVEDIRSATGEGPLAFARWRGALAAMVKAEPPTPGVYVAFTRGDEFTEVVAAALGALCAPGQFVRGV